MRSIERLIRQGLSEFLSQSERAHFEGDHADDVLQLLTAEQWIEGDQWKPAFECFADYGLVSELGQFVDEFRLWSRQVADVRGQWFYDHSEIELPSDYLSVFGHTSLIAQQLEPLLNRCRRIVRRIDELHASKPESPRAEPTKAKSGTQIPAEYRSKPISKKLAAKLLGRLQEDSGVKWLNLCIADGTITCEPHTRLSSVFDIRQFPEATHAKLLPPNSR